MKEIELLGNIEFTYKNWRGETSRRSVLVDKIVFGESKYHSGMQFIMYAFDQNKDSNDNLRAFAMKDMTKISGSFIPFSEI